MTSVIPAAADGTPADPSVAAPAAAGAAHPHAVADAMTNPTSLSHLLAEEYTMNPSTPLPSFLEMNLVDATNASGRRTLHQVLDGLRAKCDEIARQRQRRVGNERYSNEQTASAAPSLKVRLASHVSHILQHYKSEIMLVVLYGVERCSLMKSSATAAESVYGMKRTRVVMERGDSGGAGIDGGMRLVPLTDADKVRCAVVAVLLPYLKEKLALLYRKQLSSATTNDSSTRRSHTLGAGGRLDRMRRKIRSIFGTVYPYLSMTTEGASLAYQFLYLAGMTGYNAPSMHVLGVLARRITRADLQVQVQQQQRPNQQQKRGEQHRRQSAGANANGEGREIVVGNAAKPARRTEGGSNSTSANIGTAVVTRLKSGKADDIVRAIRTVIIVGGSTLLVTGWIAHFREELRQRRRRWITGEDDAGPSNSNNLVQQQQQGRPTTRDRNRNIWTQSNPIPPPHPPKLLDESESEYIRRGLPTDTVCCPMCHRPRVNPAASTSGYVFCYRCLVMHLRSNGERCPLTGMHCPESRVIRLFEPTATDASTADGVSENDDSAERVAGGGGQVAGQNTGDK